MGIQSNLIILFIIINGISAMAKWNYLGKSSTYKAIKDKYPNVTQRKWIIIEKCTYVLFGMLAFLILDSI